MPRTATIYTARRIITMYPEQPEATAVAVMEGRIVGVGDRESLRGDLACLPGTRVIEDGIFAGKVLMPGIVEAHTHLVIPALEYANHFVSQIPWPDPRGGFFPTYASKRDVLERLRELDAQLPAGELLWATHYDDNQAGGVLHRDELDAVSTRRPILVSNMVFHRFWANSCLLERAGVREGHVPPGAECDADGRPNGTLIEAPGFLLASSAFPEIVDLTREKLENILPLFRAQGITTVSELVAGSRVALDREYAQFESLFGEPGRGLRCAVYPHVHRLAEREGSLEAAIARIEELAGRGSDRLWLAGAKLYHDGSIISHTCPLEWPGYWDGSEGKHMQHEPEEIRALLLALHERGIPCVTHTNTSLAVQTVLDAVEEAQSRCCRPDIRHRVEHCYTMTAAQLRRARTLNVGVQFFTPQVYYYGDNHLRIVGRTRAENLVPTGTAERLGVSWGIHSDPPGTPQLPWQAVWATVQRRTLGGKVLGEGQRVPLAAALRAITLEAAWQIHREDSLGSIEFGKQADFCVLEEDPFLLPVDEIPRMPVWGTVTGGDIHPCA